MTIKQGSWRTGEYCSKCGSQDFCCRDCDVAPLQNILPEVHSALTAAKAALAHARRYFEYAEEYDIVDATLEKVKALS